MSGAKTSTIVKSSNDLLQLQNKFATIQKEMVDKFIMCLTGMAAHCVFESTLRYLSKTTYINKTHKYYIMTILK